MEALQPDPTRPDALQVIATYDTIYDTEGCPLHDLKQIAKAGTDERMLTSWYSADWCTDEAFADLPPEQRANPSMGSWSDKDYLQQQKRRLPAHKYRRLHLNLPGAPEGAYLDQGMVMRAVVTGRHYLPYQQGIRYFAFVDMSHGSQDDATLCIAHRSGTKVIIDMVCSQSGKPPFSAFAVIGQFAAILKTYAIGIVTGDNVGGTTYKLEFAKHGIGYKVSEKNASELYEAFEVCLNNGEVELLDQAKLIQQLVLLVMKGAKITHPSGEHDDWANCCAGAVANLAVTFSGAAQWIALGQQQQATTLRPSWTRSAVEYLYQRAQGQPSEAMPMQVNAPCTIPRGRIRPADAHIESVLPSGETITFPAGARGALLPDGRFFEVIDDAGARVVCDRVTRNPIESYARRSA